MGEFGKDFILRCLKCDFRADKVTIRDCPNCARSLIAQYENPFDKCRECVLKRGIKEQYTVSDDEHGTFTWDIDRASRIVKGTEIYELDVETLCLYLAVNITEERHYDHVDPTQPGIVAQVPLPGDPLFVLIDGSHRAGRCVRENRPFSVHVLAAPESKICLLAYDLPEPLQSKS